MIRSFRKAIFNSTFLALSSPLSPFISSESSSKAKVFASCRDRSQKPLPQSLIAVVLWQIDLVEACVRARKTILGAVVPVNVEPAETIHAFKLP